MLSYKVCKKKSRWKINYFEFDSDGYIYYPSFKSIINDNGVDIRSRYLINIILYHFDKIFDKMTKSIYSYVTSDDESDDTISMLLNEVSRLKSIVDLEYKKHLSIDKYKEYLNKLYYLDSELKRKKNYLKFNEMMEFEMGKGRSR